MKKPMGVLLGPRTNQLFSPQIYKSRKTRKNVEKKRRTRRLTWRDADSPRSQTETPFLFFCFRSFVYIYIRSHLYLIGFCHSRHVLVGAGDFLLLRTTFCSSPPAASCACVSRKQERKEITDLDGLLAVVKRNRTTTRQLFAVDMSSKGIGISKAVALYFWMSTIYRCGRMGQRR